MGDGDGNADAADADDADLVMAMPRRELYAVQGFVTDIAVGVIRSLADEHWFGREAAIAADIEAKEVRIGVLLRKDDELLVAEDGTAVFVVPVTAAATRLGPGLRALKELARVVGESLARTDCHSVEMRGYYNEDANPELRPCVLVIYEVHCHADAHPDPGLVWLPLLEAAAEPLDPIGSQVVAELYG